MREDVHVRVSSVCVNTENRGPVVFAAAGCRQNTWMRGAEEDQGGRASKFGEQQLPENSFCGTEKLLVQMCLEGKIGGAVM